jgi:hypothetical protein
MRTSLCECERRWCAVARPMPGGWVSGGKDYVEELENWRILKVVWLIEIGMGRLSDVKCNSTCWPSWVMWCDIVVSRFDWVSKKS